MERLALDRHYFARPVHTLFADVRDFFPIAEQMRVYRVVEQHVQLATEYVDSQLAHRRDLRRQPACCHASTRTGHPVPARAAARRASTARRTSISRRTSR